MPISLPASSRTDRCSKGVAVGRLRSIPEALPLPETAHRDLFERIAVLEMENRTLQVEAERAAEQARFHLAEVEHRLMNSFGVIQALAISTARPGDTGDRFRASFVPRLIALALSHSFLCSNHSAGSTLDEVVRRCLLPQMDDSGRVTVIGPEVLLSAPIVPTLGLAFHELATNATKHGALSGPAGQVEVTWQLRPGATEEERAVEILWREQGGPPVRAPTRRGFGSRLLEHGLQRRGGLVRLDFAPGGLECHMWLPLEPV